MSRSLRWFRTYETKQEINSAGRVVMLAIIVAVLIGTALTVLQYLG